MITGWSVRVRQSVHATAEGRVLPAIPSPSGGAEPSNGRICRRSPATTTASRVPVNACRARLAGPLANWAASGSSASAASGPSSGPATSAMFPRGSFHVRATQTAPSAAKTIASPSEMFAEREERHREGERERDPREGEPERRGCDRQPERPAGREERERRGDPAGPDRRCEGGRHALARRNRDQLAGGLLRLLHLDLAGNSPALARLLAQLRGEGGRASGGVPDRGAAPS